MMTMVLVYLACLLVFLALDAIWLGLLSGSIYTAVLGDLMLDQFRVTPAILFYLLQIAGILIFVLPRCRRHGSPWAALGFGALFGIATYGTYDLTNQAVLRVWTWQLTVTDMAWGACVTGIASTAGFLVRRARDRA
jgi:uncharacterized membrane protein